jgi:HK97 family phage prohead protease
MPNAIMNKIIKSYSVGVKQVGARTLQFVASTEDIDRDGEVLKADGWILDNWKKNPSFCWAHQYAEPTIGKGIDVQIIDKQLVITVEFADAETYPFADTIYKLYLGGFLNAVSVGFIPIEWETGGKKDGDPKKIYTKQELLEVSAVPVPSNPDALQQARSAKIITLKEMRMVKKALEAPESKTTGKEDDKPGKAAHSQEELADELDYIKTLIPEVGMSERTKIIAGELAEIIGRYTGSDIPEDIKAMPKKTLEAIKAACKEADDCLDNMKTHHKAHNEAYKKGSEALVRCHDSLSAMFTDDKPVEEEPKAVTPPVTAPLVEIKQTLLSRLVKSNNLVR